MAAVIYQSHIMMLSVIPSLSSSGRTDRIASGSTCDTCEPTSVPLVVVTEFMSALSEEEDDDDHLKCMTKPKTHSICFADEVPGRDQELAQIQYVESFKVVTGFGSLDEFQQYPVCFEIRRINQLDCLWTIFRAD